MKGKKEPRSRRVARIVCLILAILMLAGSAYTVIYFLISTVHAADYMGSNEVLAQGESIRVGLQYGTGAETAFSTKSAFGYVVGIQRLDGDNYPFMPLIRCEESDIAVTADRNLIKTDSGYSAAPSANNVTIGNYHIEYICDYEPLYYGEVAYWVAKLNTNSTLSAAGMSAFPVFTDGVFRIRIGSFTGQAAAEAKKELADIALPGFRTQIVAPSDDYVSLVSASDDRILFEYDCSDGTALGMRAPADANNSLIKSPKGNGYLGVLAYTPYGEGIAVTDVLTIEEYVACVVPYEVSNSWPIEALKAFAIASRTYTLSTVARHRHSDLNIDLCNAGHCQAFLGGNRINETVRQAVCETAGLVASYNGVLCTTLYSSSTGGYTVGIGDAWGGNNYDYLQPRETPWERYASPDHAYGLTVSEASPTALLKSLQENGKGCQTLSGGVSRIEILKYVPGTTYIQELRITDTKGVQVTLHTVDEVRAAFSDYVKSANFSFGRGAVEYTVDIVTKREDLPMRTIDRSVQTGVLPPFGQTSSSVTVGGALTVLTAGGQTSFDENDRPVLTASGTDAVSQPITILTAEGQRTVVRDDSGSLTALPAGAFRVFEYSVTKEKRTERASVSSNFVFASKGWGHGVGLSQWGVHDLADLGYPYDYILNAYFTDITIVPYTSLAG